jgi:hypothetical protein
VFRRLGQLVAALLVSVMGVAPEPLLAQVDEDELGAWYMYFFNARAQNSRWGVQGDLQYRNWDLLGDLEQLLIRGGVTVTLPDGGPTFTLGYANITSGQFGAGGARVREDRAYQEALLPQRIGSRVFLRHRFRFEQRWVDNQDFRTRFRYALFMDLPLKGDDLKKGALYLAFYNELFINGERDIGNGRSVERFDRNRLYGAIGYSLRDNLRVQAGYMHQYTEAVKKGQFQLSLHQAF